MIHTPAHISAGNNKNGIIKKKLLLYCHLDNLFKLKLNTKGSAFFPSYSATVVHGLRLVLQPSPTHLNGAEPQSQTQPMAPTTVYCHYIAVGSV